MQQDKIKVMVQNVLNTQDGYDFVKYLITESRCLYSEVNFDIQKFYFQSGRKSFGEEILELVRKCDFESYVKLQKERKD